MSGDVTDWSRLADSAQLHPGAIMAATVGSTDVVVWRSSEGKPCVMEARCPHQWSHLAATGAVDGEEIVCLTHMWRFDAAGHGSIEQPDGDRESRGPIKTFACVERDGGIWAG